MFTDRTGYTLKNGVSLINSFVTLASFYTNAIYIISIILSTLTISVIVFNFI